MAHAGSSTGLAKQPAVSSSWNGLFSAIVMLAVGVGIVLAVLLITGGKATTAPAVDRRFDQIEIQRGATTLSGVDQSNAAFLNAAAAKARAMSAVSADTSYDLLENLRAQRGVASDFSVARGTRLDATSVDRKYQEIQRRAAATSLDRKVQEL